MTFLDHLNLPKFDFTQSRSDGKIIIFQQSQGLTSHFESLWSIVQLSNLTFVILFSTCCHLVFAVLALSLDFLFGLRIWLIRLCAFLSNETSSDFRFRANSFILFSDSKDLILDSFLRVCFFKVDISRFRCVSISRWRLSVSFIF